ncbi:MAG: hypothetical protein WD016_08225 [Balneolaceae bacterium]
MEPLEIIAYHGWGFDAGFWNPWKKIIPAEITFKTASRGYFFDEKSPRFSNSDSTKILFLHSFGLHWYPLKHIETADCIVIFNGFPSFHPEEPSLQKKSKIILEKMIAGFEKNPQKVLQQFWENTFFPSKNNFSKQDFDKSLLQKDLQLLHKSKFTSEHFKTGKSIICVDGGRDKILGNPRGKEFMVLTKRNAVYHFIKEAGHALPATHTADCWSFINAMIAIFGANGNYRTQRHQ